MAFNWAKVPRCTSMPWMVVFKSCRFRLSHWSTALRSAMRLSSSSMSMVGMAAEGIWPKPPEENPGQALRKAKGSLGFCMQRV